MTREAIFINAETKAPIMDLDPGDMHDLGGGFVHPFNRVVMNMLDVVIEFETSSPNGPALSLVWSDDLTPVRFTCPECDDCARVDDDAEITDIAGRLDHLVCFRCLDE